jgi:hypothetical protein
MILFFVVFSLKAYAQYFDAELYFLDGTHKNGIARINILNDKIYFKNNKQSKKEKYNHKEIGRLILKKDSIAKTFHYKKTIGRRAPKLLETMIEDANLSLYAVVTKSNYLYSFGLVGVLASTLVDTSSIDYEYYMVKGNSGKAIYFGDTKLTSRKRLREIVKKQLKKCPVLLRKSKNKEFKVKDIPKIVRFYNKNCSSKQP